MQFTCNLCGTRNEHSISRRAYTKGTVIVTCPGCNATHLVADNLNWIEDDFVNLEEYMAKQGTPITRIANDGVAAAAAAAAAPPPAEEPEEESAAPAPSKLDGISDEQARSRDAIRDRRARCATARGGVSCVTLCVCAERDEEQEKKLGKPD